MTKSALPQFIVLDGPDGSGTSTHSALLAKKLESHGHDVLLTAQPSDGPIGQEVRHILNGKHDISPDALQLLFCADRAQHVAETIAPALDAGKTVVCDRYSYSTLVYGEALGLDRGWLQGVNDAFLTPDLTIIALPPLKVCLERIGIRGTEDILEGQSLQTKVYQGYANISGENIVTIDTSADIESVSEMIWSAAIEKV